MLALAALLLAMPLSAQDDKLWRELAIIENPGLFRLAETQDEFRPIIPSIATNCPDISTARDVGDKAYTIWEDLKEGGIAWIPRDGKVAASCRHGRSVRYGTERRLRAVHGDVYVAEEIRSVRPRLGDGDHRIGARHRACRCLGATASATEGRNCRSSFAGARSQQAQSNTRDGRRFRG